MKAKILGLLRNRKLIYGLLLVACLGWGIVQTAATYDASLGMGDNSTFYAFTRNVVDGEAMYKDFIHFRTPGTITLFAGLMEIFGQQQSTIEICTRIETLVLYPLIFLISAMIIFRKRNPWYVAIAWLGLALIPGVAQLRAAFGLLAIAIYSLSFDIKRPERRKWYLLASGFLLAVTFFFGQEIALMVGLCLLAGEVFGVERQQLWQRLGYISLGAVAGLLPLLIYLLAFSSLSNFLYYTLYYSFVLQPKFMNLPFPDFGFVSLMYWLPFVMYWLCFLVLYTNKKLGIKEGLLLSFGILRLITAVGRSDFGHFLFSIPEVFLIVPYLMLQSRTSDFRSQMIRRFAPYGAVLALLLYLATKNGIALAAVPFVILLALRLRSDKQAKLKASPPTKANFNVYWLLGSLLVLFVYMLTPTYLAVARYVKQEIFTDDSKAFRIGGVKTDEVNYREIKAIQAEVDPIHPKTVFAFPIQPFFYSLANKHASRFLTFEPQTTVREQDETIQDLRDSKPEVVIFDPLQAHGLSGSLWKISDYITSHYRLQKEVVMREDLWVMVPKDQPSRDDKLVFQLFHGNNGPTAKTDAIAIQNTAEGLNSAIKQNSSRLQFVIDSKAASNLHVSLLDGDGKRPEQPLCAAVIVKYQDKKPATTQKICVSDGEITIRLEKSTKPLTIRLDNPAGQPVIWNNASVTD